MVPAAFAVDAIIRSMQSPAQDLAPVIVVDETARTGLTVLTGHSAGELRSHPVEDDLRHDRPPCQHKARHAELARPICQALSPDSRSQASGVDCRDRGACRRRCSDRPDHAPHQSWPTGGPPEWHRVLAAHDVQGLSRPAVDRRSTGLSCQRDAKAYCNRCRRHGPRTQSGHRSSCWDRHGGETREVF